MSACDSVVKGRGDFAGPSKSALLVMNGREGRLTISLRKVSAGAGKRQNKGLISWFPPAKDMVASRVTNRKIGASVAQAFVEVHAIDAGAAYSFAIAMARTPGMEVHARMSRWLDAAREKRTPLARVEIGSLTNAPARFVSGGRTA